jgi:O-acetyl-ADP-ribose deacetylase (regulator of RNase III)
MPLNIILDDITNVVADVYVNSAHQEVQIGTGVDARIHQQAGPQLFEARQNFGPLSFGEVFLSDGFSLKAKKVYHILTPVFEMNDSVSILKNTYLKCLEEATKEGFETIAFPLLASGNHGFPKPLSLEIALSVFRTFLETHEIHIILTVFDKANYQIEASKKIFDSFDEPISDRMIFQNIAYESARSFPSLSESFHTLLFNWIDEKKMSDVEVYKRANISRKLFSKIRSDRDYQPSKKTVISLSIGLKLNLDQTLDLLASVGFTLSESLLFDQIVKSFILREVYDIFEVNEVLFYYDLPVL